MKRRIKKKKDRKAEEKAREKAIKQQEKAKGSYARRSTKRNYKIQKFYLIV